MHTVRKHMNFFEAKQAPSTAMEMVFVYGSLKRGFHNHRLIAKARFIGAGQTAPRFDLLNLGMFPAVVRGKHMVTGEVYEVDATMMKELDILESNGFMYLRKKVPISVDGKKLAAWMYIYLDDDGMEELVQPDGMTVTWAQPAPRWRRNSLPKKSATSNRPHKANDCKSYGKGDSDIMEGVCPAQ